MSPALTRTTALLTVLDAGHTPAAFPCQFNPNELSINRSNVWSGAPGVASGPTPAVHFSGTSPRTLQLNLTFDTYDEASRRDIARLMPDLPERDVSAVTGLI